MRRGVRLARAGTGGELALTALTHRRTAARPPLTQPGTATRRRRRLLVVGLALTVLVMLLDLAHAAAPAALRAAGATVFGGAERVLGGVEPGRVAALEEQNALLRAQLARDDVALTQAAALGRLFDASSPIAKTVTAQHETMLPARVVGAATTASGVRQLTLDIGSQDGVQPDVAVVSADGLVGRVVSVSPWSCDVRVLGGADAVVGVRTGAGKVIGSVTSSPPAGVPARPRGALTLVLAGQGTVRPGDVVTTLGSVGDRPHLPGIVVGTVASLDPPRGQLTGTAVVTPAVDPGDLEVVGVLMGPAR